MDNNILMICPLVQECNKIDNNYNKCIFHYRPHRINKGCHVSCSRAAKYFPGKSSICIPCKTNIIINEDGSYDNK